MVIVTDNKALEKVCEGLRRTEYFAVDTEFLRESTYWSKLCLIQVAGGDVEAIIDPLAEGLDMRPFLSIMADTSITKVFHAARQDLEIFYRLMGQVPLPLFDSQIAAMAAGLGDSIGYDTLVQKMLKKSVDKGSRFTDWSRRPLSDKQLTYAIGDVTHLRDLYPLLIGRLNDRDRLSWVDEEMAGLINPGIYQFDPEDAWRRMKIRKYSPQWLAVMRLVSRWREREAQTRDKPRGRILKDDAIYELAQQAPRSVEALGRMRAVPRGFERSSMAQGLLAAINEAMSNPEEHAPQISRPPVMPSGLGPVVELLKVLLRIKAEDLGVAPRLIANAADIERLAAFDDADIAALKGWRFEAFGKDALRLKNGELSLTLKGKRAVIEQRQG
ncbi:MAG: ribonuclease D [Robiginitomaculum sp.]|nr:MAG: ribonuclease D [Robiginitomaculum sp.]